MTEICRKSFLQVKYNVQVEEKLDFHVKLKLKVMLNKA